MNQKTAKLINKFDLVAHIAHQRNWSLVTFGPGQRTGMMLNHIAKELEEIRAKPDDLSEWIDVVLLAIDGAWRCGYEPEEIAMALATKLTKK